MPDEHARLAPSSSHRWLGCPASVRLAEELGTEVDNRFTREGTLAHTRAELEVSFTYGRMTRGQYDAGLRKWARNVRTSGGGDDDFDLADMELHAREYVAAIQELCDVLDEPSVKAEMRVRPGVPECWGTSDAIILSRKRLDVWDYKYGTGLLVYPADNPQLKLYGLGALEEYGLLEDIEEVVLHIYQPRVGSKAWRTWGTEAAELLRWRDEHVIPVAQQALKYDAPFGPSAEACRWCPASGQCRAQLETVVAAEFVEDVDLLSPEEMAAALDRVPLVKVWLGAVEERALSMAYDDGLGIPGFKVVRSGGRRHITDQEEAEVELVVKGFHRDDFLAPRKLTTLGVLGKLKNESGEVALDLLEQAGLLIKGEGKLSLTKDTDGRKGLTPGNQAAQDFAEGGE